MKATTDSGPTEPNSKPSEPVENIFTIMDIVSEPSTVAFFRNQYAQCQIRYGDLKKQLAEDVITSISPIRERIEEIYQDEAYLHRVAKMGAEKAAESAEKTVAAVREIMGIYKF